MTKKHKSLQKAQLHTLAKDVEQPKENSNPPAPAKMGSKSGSEGEGDPEAHALNANSSRHTSPRIKHNRKNSRPPIFFHREFEVPHGYLSQWYISPFTDPTTNLTFNCCEQYMMYSKAILRSDATTASEIMSTPYPKDQKALGRCVQN